MPGGHFSGSTFEPSAGCAKEVDSEEARFCCTILLSGEKWYCRESKRLFKACKGGCISLPASDSGLSLATAGFF